MNEVFIYRNLHKNCWSIRDHKTKQVIGYADTLILKNVRFVVSETSRQRVIREKRKNVHAGVIGTLIEKNIVFPNWSGYNVVTYNPYQQSKFQVAGDIIEKTDVVYFGTNGLVITGEKYED